MLLSATKSESIFKYLSIEILDDFCKNLPPKAASDEKKKHFKCEFLHYS